MRQIRSGDTKPEIVVRSILHRQGYRFTVHGPKNNALPGKPDIVLPKHRTVVFVHGCFWHLHSGCREGRKPATNKVYWGPKLDRTVERDQQNQAALEALGWHVTVIWECEIEGAKDTRTLTLLIQSRLNRAPRFRYSVPDQPEVLAKVAESARNLE